ncbi:hypothetical protein DF185_12805 [Marinifilum breve]|uniref:Uncharacterized protein n=1 Tax=Marinifilum breve TaxID=2184082 RepID=A0A2V3ZWE7_9BACT|nr:outer membrane beta-barrel protein [Marinifilum breve]PXY00779.1 hypothetical protein DF185_12805 [Marinifilum breve]
MRLVHHIAIIVSVLCFSSIKTEAQNKNQEHKFFLKLYGGGSHVANMNINGQDAELLNSIHIDTKIGFSSGISIGYQWNEKIATVLGWEYKSNSSSTSIDNLEYDGNYASNIIYLDGLYSLYKNDKSTLYTGAGLAMIEEIDLDYETNGSEVSFSESGRIGVHLILAYDYELSRRWILNTELRKSFFSKFDLKEEGGSNQTLVDLKYNPTTLNIGIKYMF